MLCNQIIHNFSFVGCKKQIELEKLKTSDPTNDNDTEGWENERKLYKNLRTSLNFDCRTQKCLGWVIHLISKAPPYNLFHYHGSKFLTEKFPRLSSIFFILQHLQNSPTGKWTTRQFPNVKTVSTSPRYLYQFSIKRYPLCN